MDGHLGFVVESTFGVAPGDGAKIGLLGYPTPPNRLVGMVPYYRRKLRGQDATTVYLRGPGGTRHRVVVEGSVHETFVPGKSYTLEYY